MVGDLHEAEDLVQEALFKVASKWPRVSAMENPLAYTRRILINLVLHGSSKRSRNRAELKATPPAESASNAAHLDIHDELFDALDAKTRIGLRRLIRGFASWYDGEAAQAHLSAQYFPPALGARLTRSG